MSWFKPKRIFLDYASATPVLEEVRKAMEKYWSEDFYNPSAIYDEGVRVKKKVEDHRARMARALGAAQESVVFTSGGTESDNLAILGIFEESLKKIKKPHIVVSAIEHPAVAAAAQEVVRRGGEMSVLEVDETGLVSLETLPKLLKANTVLVSIGLANSEIGTVEPVAKVGRLIRQYRKDHRSIYPYLHSDVSQALNYLDTGLEHLQADLLTLDSSKIYGPKGIGLLALRRGVKIHPIIFGGEQERGRRAGTLNPALVAGFTLALELAIKDREKESRRLDLLRGQFIGSMAKRLPHLIVNGSPENHLPNIASVSLPGTLAEFMLLKLDRAGIMASVGSACSNDGRISGSPVIRALGKKDLAESTLRFSFGRFTTASDIKRAAEIFCKIAQSMVK
jgi:cysteine desulfurase